MVPKLVNLFVRGRTHFSIPLIGNFAGILVLKLVVNYIRLLQLLSIVEPNEIALHPPSMILSCIKRPEEVLSNHLLLLKRVQYMVDSFLFLFKLFLFQANQRFQFFRADLLLKMALRVILDRLQVLIQEQIAGLTVLLNCKSFADCF